MRDIFRCRLARPAQWNSMMDQGLPGSNLEITPDNPCRRANSDHTWKSWLFRFVDCIDFAATDTVDWSLAEVLSIGVRFKHAF